MLPAMSAAQTDLAAAIAALQDFYGAHGLTVRIASLERKLAGKDYRSVQDTLRQERVNESGLAAALAVKRVAGQVNTAIHALSIALALPALLEEGEVILGSSLGAGSGGCEFDLETDRRVAEFKLTTWRGGSEPVRQNELFADVFHLAETDIPKRRELYLTELHRPLRFLNNRRALKSVLAKRAVAEDFFARHGDRYTFVHEYWQDVRDRITLIDLTTLVPAIAALPPEADTPAS
jgi:hypothetical protein